MLQKNIGMGAALLILAALAGPQPARAAERPLTPTLERFALADYVAVGTITALEERAVALQPFAGSRRNEEHQIALLRIDNGLKGTSGLTHLRVAFVPSAGLVVGQQACFFLVRHFSEPLAVFSNGYMFLPLIRKDDTSFAKQLELCQRLARLPQDSTKALTSPDRDVRLLAAGLLIGEQHAREQQAALVRRGAEEPALQKSGPPPLDAARSKLILDVLAAADWGDNLPSGISPQVLFSSLNLSPHNDDWHPALFRRGFKTDMDFEAGAKKWLKENAGTYRLTTYVRQFFGC